MREKTNKNLYIQASMVGLTHHNELRYEQRQHQPDESLTNQYLKKWYHCKAYIKVVYAIPTCKVGIGDDKNSLRAIEIRFSARLLLKARHFIYIIPWSHHSLTTTSEFILIFHKLITIIMCRYLQYADTTHKKVCE